MTATAQMRDRAARTNDPRHQAGRAIRQRRAGLALAAATVALALAGCGGSKPLSVASVATTTSTSASAGTTSAGDATGSGAATSHTQPQQDALKFARCMRAHGEPNFPDPSGSGGFTFNAGNGVNPSSPAFQAAQARCQKYTPFGGGGLAPGTQTHPSAQWLATMVKAARCIRHHGIPNFPAPTITVPSPKVLGGAGVISNIEGAVFTFPAAVDPQSPLFVRAATVCHFPLHNH